METLGGAAQQARGIFLPIASSDPSLAFEVSLSVYRGYPPNSGWTSQRVLDLDASDLLDAVMQNLSRGSRVLLGGTSMGAAVAAQLAAERPESVAGLVVSSPWSTLWAETLAFDVPFTWLLWPWLWESNRFDSVAAVASLPQDLPVAVLSSTGDRVISPAEQRDVFVASTAAQKWWLPVDAGHADNWKMARAEASHLRDWVLASVRVPSTPEVWSWHHDEMHQDDDEKVHCWTYHTWPRLW